MSGRCNKDETRYGVYSNMAAKGGRYSNGEAKGNSLYSNSEAKGNSLYSNGEANGGLYSNGEARSGSNSTTDDELTPTGDLCMMSGIQVSWVSACSYHTVLIVCTY